jgi:UDP-glucose 4-epimerase
MQLKNKKVVVTGGAGFIPSHVVDLLVEKGARVTVLDNLRTGKMENLEKSKGKFIFKKMDIRDFKKVQLAIKEQDIVFHLAANADVPLSVKLPRYDFNTNVIGGFNVLKNCLDLKISKVIYASTAAVYGEPKYVPTDEKHLTNPCSPYGASKLSTELLGFAYFKTYGLPFTAIRIFNTYGERQARFVMFDLLKKLYRDNKKLEVLGTGNQIRDYCYVTDTARAFILAAENDNTIGEVFNLAGGNTVSIKELVDLLVKTTGFKDVKVTYTGKSWNGDIMKFVADTNKIRSVLGFNPEVNLEEGVKKLNDWLIKQR